MRAPRNVETMVRELDARQQIHDCIMRDCRGIDHRDLDHALSAYHPDAEDDHGFFSDLAEPFIRAGIEASGHFETIRHIIANEYVEFDSTNLDIALSETVSIGCLLSREGDAYNLFAASCRFLDRFEQRAGEWKIARRRLVLDWQAKGPVDGLVGGALTAGMLRRFANPADPSFELGFRHWGTKAPTEPRLERVGGASQAHREMREERS